MDSIGVLMSHLGWLIGIIVVGGLVGIAAAINGASKKDADAYRWLISAILVVIYMFIRFR